MPMKASRLTNKSKISKKDDVEYCVRYFSIVIAMGNLLRGNLRLGAIFAANGLGPRGVFLR
ncbi:MAG TPA: hypothetical protein VJ810_29255, partial [Blastocatellia bacterium]|nr:hypothetical protein [Blastocatellia bacterium]